MTSTTLNYKGGFRVVFAKTFKQQLPGAIILICIAFFAAVFNAANMIITNVNNSYRTNNKCDITYDTVWIVHYFCIFSIVFSFFLAMQMFKEIYSKRACDTFFALPIKRSDYFIAKYLYGAAVNIIAVLVLSAINVIILLSASTKVITYTIDFGEFVKIVTAFLLNLLLIYTIFIFCAVLAGKKVQYFFLSAIALLAPMFITTGAVDLINTIWGVDASSFISTIIHPVQNIYMLWENDIEYILSVDKYLLIIIFEIIEAVIFFVIGYRVFQKRKAETAEFEPSDKIISLVILAFLVAAVFLQLTSTVKYYFAIPLAIVFAVISTMIYSGIFYKKVFAKNTVITLAVSSAVCLLFFGIVSLPSYSGYVKYVPEIDDIESVELIDGYYDSVSYNGSSYYSDSMTYGSELSGTFKFSADEGIRNAVELHKKIVDDKTIKKGKAINSSTWGDMMAYDYEYESSFDCRIVYHLKGGKVVTRTYSVPVKMISDEMVNLMKTDEALSQYGITSIKNENIVYSTFESEIYTEDSDDYNKVSKSLTLQQTEEIMNLYKKDLLNLNKADFLYYLNEYTGYYYDDYSYDYYDKPVDTEEDDYITENSYWVYIMHYNQNADDEYREYIESLSAEELNKLSVASDEYYEKLETDSIYVYPEYENTYNYLKSEGLIK